MQDRPSAPPNTRTVAPATSAEPRAAYVRPTLERLGTWRALTLQQSVCTGPGCDLLDLT